MFNRMKIQLILTALVLVQTSLISFSQEKDVDAIISAELHRHPEHFYMDSIKMTLTLKNNTAADISTGRTAKNKITE